MSKRLKKQAAFWEKFIRNTAIFTALVFSLTEPELAVYCLAI